VILVVEHPATETARSSIDTNTQREFHSESLARGFRLVEFIGSLSRFPLAQE
jgi:hypothetical protein